jgi:hypothetical protein
MMNKERRLKLILITEIICLAICICPPDLPAFEITPFATRNQSPMIQIFGLPSIGEAPILYRGKSEAGLTVDLTNNYASDSNNRERILLDGESTRFTLSGRYGLGRELEVGLEIPYVIQGGGFLDSFIENYHSAFGFPNGGREQAPRNRLLYQYDREGKNLLRVNESDNGPGDVKVLGGYQIYRDEGKPGRALAVRASLKFPTGDSAHLLGSGSTDLALWVVGSDDFNLSLGRLTVFGAAGALAMTKGDILSDQQRPIVGFGSLGAGWAPLRWLALKIQTDAHTPFYRNSDLRELNAFSAQLTVGGTLAFSPKTTLDIGVSEDVIVKTSPDVVFHLSLRHRF